MTTTIPAISIRQPWAELILRDRKSLELRSWSTDYRGELWLHTGRRGHPRLEEELGLDNLYKGGYVGTIVLTAIIPMNQDRWESWQTKHLDPGDYRSGMYAWVLSSPHRFQEPIQGPGQLGLFFPSPPIEARLREGEFA